MMFITINIVIIIISSIIIIIIIIDTSLAARGGPALVLRLLAGGRKIFRVCNVLLSMSLCA